jgi:outer membrane lipoprotein-sorting protein
MLKFLSKIVVTAVLVSLTGNAQAQLPSASPSIPPVQPQPSGLPSPLPNNSTPTPTPTPTPTTAPSATNLDLQLLSKAVGKFWQGNRSQTQSQIVMTIQGKTTNAKLVQINATSKTTAQTGDRFRSQLTISKVGNPSKLTYTIVGNGKNVWVYSPAKRQYAKYTFAAFKSEYYSTLIGLSSVFFVSMPESTRQQIVASLKTNSNPLSSIPLTDIKNLQGSNRLVDGQNLYVYSYDNKEEKLSFNGLVQPDTGMLKQIEFVSNDERADLKITEKIISHTTSNNTTDRTFRFTPPRGTTQVKSVSNDLIKLLQ